MGEGMRNFRPPDLLSARLRAAREFLPLERKSLVGPGHVHRLGLDMKPPVTDKPGPHSKPTAVGLGGRERDRPLRPARLRPEPFEDPAALRDLNQGPPRVIARANDRGKLAARLDGVCLRLHHEGPLDSIPTGRRIDHLHDLGRPHRRNVAGGGNLERGPVDAGRQVGRRDLLARRLLGHHFLLIENLASGPGLGVGSRGLGRLGGGQAARAGEP